MVLVPYGTGRVGRRRSTSSRAALGAAFVVNRSAARAGPRRGRSNVPLRRAPYAVVVTRFGGPPVVTRWGTASCSRLRGALVVTRWGTASCSRLRGAGRGRGLRNVSWRSPPRPRHDAAATSPARRRAARGGPEAMKLAGGRRAAPAGSPVLPDQAPAGRWAGQWRRPAEPERIGVVHTCARAGTVPARLARVRRLSERRCGWSLWGAGGAGRFCACDRVASPSVANSSAVPTASRTRTRSERDVVRGAWVPCSRVLRWAGRWVVVGGNMCS